MKHVRLIKTYLEIEFALLDSILFRLHLNNKIFFIDLFYKYHRYVPTGLTKVAFQFELSGSHIKLIMFDKLLINKIRR